MQTGIGGVNGSHVRAPSGQEMSGAKHIRN